MAAIASEKSRFWPLTEIFCYFFCCIRLHFVLSTHFSPLLLSDNLVNSPDSKEVAPITHNMTLHNVKQIINGSYIAF